MDNPPLKHFYELRVWQKAHALTLHIYTLTNTFPRDELFGLTSQARRASSSIGANIAEGFGKYYFKEKVRFYLQARGSDTELQNHLILSKDLKYITLEEYDIVFREASLVVQDINGAIRAIDKLLSAT